MEISSDVVIAGGGNAALCAALTARECGASVTVLECAPPEFRGGNSRHTRNMRCMHDAPTDVLTGSYTEEEYFADVLRVTGGETDESLARLVIRESPNAAAWARSHGVRFQPSLGGTLHLGRTNAFFLGGGKALMNAYYEAAARQGVRVIYNAEVIGLDIGNSPANSRGNSPANSRGNSPANSRGNSPGNSPANSRGNSRDSSRDRGRFLSGEVLVEGKPIEFNAKSFIAASGGFEANLDWLKEAWGEAAENFVVRGTPYNKGKVLKLLLDHGAEPVGDPRQCHAVAIDGRAPKFDGGIVTRLDCVPLGIVVNRDGERFYDEGEDLWPKRYAIWGRLVAQQPGQIAYSIIDSKVLGRFMPSVFPAIRAASIAELAALLDLPPGKLTATVDAFNRAVEPGHFDHNLLDDCRTQGIVPGKSHWAQKIDTPPFLGYPLRPGITFTYLGVKVNERAEVQMKETGSSPNVFAAGEIMAGNILGKGYPAGFGMTIGAVFGRIAGREAARVAKS